MKSPRPILAAIGAGVIAAGAAVVVSSHRLPTTSVPPPVIGKAAPPCEPWPACYAAASPLPTSAPTTVPTSAPTAAPTVVSTSAPTAIAPATGQLFNELPDPFSYATKFHRGFADDLAVYSTIDRVGNREPRLIVRENYGASIWRLSSLQLAALWDLESRFPKVGDGFQTVAKVAAADDGSRFLVHWKQDTHRTLVLDDAGRVLGEFGPTRAYGGVAIVRTTPGAPGASSLVGLALTSGGLWRADLTGMKPGAAVQFAGAPGGAGGLSASGPWATYATPAGALVIVRNGATANVIDGLQVACVSVEGPTVLAGVSGGYRRIGVGGFVGDRVLLPGTPAAVALVNGRPWSIVGDAGRSALYLEAARVATIPDQYGAPVILRGAPGALVIGTGSYTLVIRVAQ